MPFTFKLSMRLALMKASPVVVAAAVLTACDIQRNPGTGVDNPVAQVIVSPDTLTLDPFENHQFQVFGRTQAGDSVPVSVRWSASAGPITASGMYTADTSAADATLTATLASGPVSGTSKVRKRRLIRIVIDPKTATVSAGGARQFTVYGRKNTGDSVSVSVTYTATGGAISGGGGYTAGQTAGTYRVVAKQNGGSLADTATVTVAIVPVAAVTVTPASVNMPVGLTAQLAATPRDASGNPLAGRVVTWASSNAAVASVSGGGLVTAVAAGVATITAASEGQSGSATITVTIVPVASVGVSPASVNMAIGLTAQLTATPRDASGNPLSGRVVTWASSNAAVATVNGSGLVTAVAAGTATITAMSEGQSGSATITVTIVPVASVGVSPASVNMAIGLTAQLTATPRDASGNPLAGRVVTWASNNAGVATVSGSGLVTAVAAGTATITATSEGQSGTAAVTVGVVPVASVVMSPATASLTVGQTVQLGATPRDANGNALTGRVVTWASSAPAVASVNGSGLVTAVAAGTATITATSEGQSGSATITVTIVPVASVAVSPATASLTVGQTVQLTATPKDASGTPLSGRVVTWVSSAPGVATVSGSGLVTAVTAGTATITATSEGRSGTAGITVTLAPVASVTVSPANASVAVAAVQQLTATLKDASGNTLTGRTVTWSSSSPTIAGVSGLGLVTGLVAGTATITATSEGRSGSATITVVPGGGGGVTLLQESFDNANLDARGWYDGGPATISTTEYSSGGGSIEARFLAGAVASSWGTKRHLFTPSPSVYVSFWVKYSTNWVGSGRLYHPHEFVILSDLDGDWDGPSNNYLTAYIEQVYRNGGVPQLALQDGKNVNLSFGTPPNNLVGVTENRSVSGCNGHTESSGVDVWTCFNMPPWYSAKEYHAPAVAFQPTPGPGYKSDWNHVEAYFQMNSVVGGIGQTDGIVRYWFNGVLVIDRTNVLLRTGAHPTLNFKQIILAPYIGDGSPADQTVWYDDLRVGTVRP